MWSGGRRVSGADRYLSRRFASDRRESLDPRARVDALLCLSGPGSRCSTIKRLSTSPSSGLNRLQEHQADGSPSLMVLHYPESPSGPSALAHQQRVRVCSTTEEREANGSLRIAEPISRNSNLSSPRRIQVIWISAAFQFAMLRASKERIGPGGSVPPSAAYSTRMEP